MLWQQDRSRGSPYFKNRTFKRRSLLKASPLSLLGHCLDYSDGYRPWSFSSLHNWTRGLAMKSRSYIASSPSSRFIVEMQGSSPAFVRVVQKYPNQDGYVPEMIETDSIKSWAVLGSASIHTLLLNPRRIITWLICILIAIIRTPQCFLEADYSTWNARPFLFFWL